MLTLLFVVGQLFTPTDTSLAATARALKHSQLLIDTRTSTTFQKPPTACGMLVFVVDDRLDPGMARRISGDVLKHAPMRIVKPPMCGEFDGGKETRTPAIRFGSETPPESSPAPPAPPR